MKPTQQAPKEPSAEEQRRRAAAGSRPRKTASEDTVRAGRNMVRADSLMGDSRHVQGSSVHMDKHHCPVLHVSEHRYRHRKQSAHTGREKALVKDSQPLA